MTHDYVRHGTTTLFAALNVLDGTVIGRRMQRHRHQVFIRFLNVVEAAVPAGRLIHAILDNYGSHKHPKVRSWLERHPRWTFHYTPTSGSWLERGRDLLLGHDPASAETRCVPFAGRTAGRDQALPRRP
jgi:transposase